MTKTTRCPWCSTPNARQRARCRACGGILPRLPTTAIAPREGHGTGTQNFKGGKSTRLVLDMMQRRLQEMEAATKQRLHLWEKRLMAWEIALGRREKALAKGGAGSQKSTPESNLGDSSPSSRDPWHSERGVDRPISRVRTHVRGLDEALRGGVPEGSVVLISGAPGTMKTSLGLFILATNAISDHRSGLYVTFGQRAESVLRHLDALGFDISRTEGLLDVLDATLLSRSAVRAKRDWLKDLKESLNRLAGDRLELLVIDSLDALEVVTKFRNRREELFRLFEWLRDLKLTSFVIAERPDFIVRGNVLQGRHDEDFLADGMISLRLHPITDVELQRRIRVVKMRGTAHDTGYMAFHVSPEREFEVVPAIGS